MEPHDSKTAPYFVIFNDYIGNDYVYAEQGNRCYAIYFITDEELADRADFEEMIGE